MDKMNEYFKGEENEIILNLEEKFDRSIVNIVNKRRLIKFLLYIISDESAKAKSYTLQDLKLKVRDYLNSFKNDLE